MLKAKIVIKENVKTSKYQNIKVGLNGENELALSITGSKKSWIYQLLSFNVSSRNFVNQELISSSVILL